MVPPVHAHLLDAVENIFATAADSQNKPFLSTAEQQHARKKLSEWLSPLEGEKIRAAAVSVLRELMSNAAFHGLVTLLLKQAETAMEKVVRGFTEQMRKDPGYTEHFPNDTKRDVVAYIADKQDLPVCADVGYLSCERVSDDVVKRFNTIVKGGKKKKNVPEGDELQNMAWSLCSALENGVKNCGKVEVLQCSCTGSDATYMVVDGKHVPHSVWVWRTLSNMTIPPAHVIKVAGGTGPRTDDLLRRGQKRDNATIVNCCAEEGSFFRTSKDRYVSGGWVLAARGEKKEAVPNSNSSSSIRVRAHRSTE